MNYSRNGTFETVPKIFLLTLVVDCDQEAIATGVLVCHDALKCMGNL
jgi:hypothetical protein